MADLTSGSLRKMTAATDREVAPSIAPGGDLMAFAADFNYSPANSSEWECERTQRGPTWSPDGN